MYDISYRSEVAGWEKPSQFSMTYAVTSAFFIATMVASIQSLRIAFQTPKIVNSNSKQTHSRTNDPTLAPKSEKTSDIGQNERASVKKLNGHAQSIQSALNWNFKLFTFINVITWVIFLSLSLILTKYSSHMTRYRVSLLCAMPAFFIESMFRKRIKHQSTGSRLLSNNNIETFGIDQSVIISQ
jgi:Flp pilus assembly protein TadB